MGKFGVYDEETGRMTVFSTYMDAVSASQMLIENKAEIREQYSKTDVNGGIKVVKILAESKFFSLPKKELKKITNDEGDIIGDVYITPVEENDL